MRVEFVEGEVHIWLHIDEITRNLNLCKQYNATYTDGEWYTKMTREEFIEFVSKFQDTVKIDGEGINAKLVLPEITEEVEQYLNKIRDKNIL